jgi:hypothetical protein
MRVRINFRTSPNGVLDTLGVFSISNEEAGDLEDILRKHANPLDAIKHLPAGLLRDTFSVMADEGYHVELEWLD